MEYKILSSTPGIAAVSTSCMSGGGEREHLSFARCRLKEVVRSSRTERSLDHTPSKTVLHMFRGELRPFPHFHVDPGQKSFEARLLFTQAGKVQPGDGGVLMM